MDNKVYCVDCAHVGFPRLTTLKGDWPEPLCVRTKRKIRSNPEDLVTGGSVTHEIKTCKEERASTDGCGPVGVFYIESSPQKPIIRP
jgi:hypothetical protein